MADYDLAIIGGGLNGVSVARDAAGRGLRVILLEQGDLGAAASSATPRLIHGDLAVLERRGFLRVRAGAGRARHLAADRAASGAPDALCDPRPCRRAAALAAAVVAAALRPAGRRAARLPASATVDVTHHPVGNALKRPFGTAFEYSDCVVDDSRLVVAHRRRCRRARRRDPHRRALRPRRPRRHLAAGGDRSRPPPGDHGAGAGQRHRRLDRDRSPKPCCACRRRALGAVQISQIVVRRLFDTDNVYVFQNSDRRLIFASPYERDFTLIGTVGHAFKGDPAVGVDGGRRHRLSLRRRQPLFSRAGRSLRRGQDGCPAPTR